MAGDRDRAATVLSVDGRILLPDGARAPPWTRFLRWSTKQFGVVMTLIWVSVSYTHLTLPTKRIV